MSKTKLPYSETGYFSKLICDYLEEVPALKPFYNKFPQLANFESQKATKQNSYSERTRTILSAQLAEQYEGFDISEATQKNISALKQENSFTITTGHQLNLFTGPLYFLYKIFSVINLTETLNKEYTDSHFVPVYWMATEDHDFDEINYFNFEGEKISWNRSSQGAVGDLDTTGLEILAKELQQKFGATTNGKQLQQLFSDAYLKHDTLAAATRYLGNELFKAYGLVIVDGNDKKLKELFVPFAKKELTNQTSYQKVRETTHRLTELGYPEQVHPREINLFYLKNGLRERIVAVNGTFFINETDISFSKEELLQELQDHPERFSPNALLRPLYQEVILPNLCYVGGGGELAYWFQLKDYFESVDVPFPLLLLRNSALLISEKEATKLEKLNLSVAQLFQKQSALQSDYTRQLSEIEIDFSEQRTHLVQQFKDLYELAEKTDASFIGAVGAQEKKQLNGLDHLEKRLLKAQKRKLNAQLARATTLQDRLFPKQSLQERHSNFSEFYAIHGDALLSLLKAHLDPLRQEFTVLRLP